ncbi:MAG: hypothetical protein J1E65_08820 [Lachnospiraceae bacterium]|nr:hypothetical protein [Lachnospiraceae bacterium]
MKKRIIISAAAFALAAVVGVGIFVSWSGNEKEIQYLSASWSYNYSGIEELSVSSDLIALVKVSGIEDTVIEVGIPYTTFAVEVVTPVYNTVEGDRFTIYMTGGETEDKVVEIADDPLLQVGDEILVFCKENPDGTYQILSGSQGRLVYEDGKLNSLNAMDTRIAQANVYNNVKVANADAETLIAEIKGYVKAE